MPSTVFSSFILSIIIWCSSVNSADVRGKLIFALHHNEVSLRKSRDINDNIDVNAIQTTINDHRTLIEDNRLMINNIINNPINNTNLQQIISYHYATQTPIWNSWRDVALIFVTTIIIIQIICICVSQIKLKPCDYAVSRILDRHVTRESQKQRQSIRSPSTDHINNRTYKQKPTYLSPRQQLAIKSVEEEYEEVQRNSRVI
mgnify:CR=1 FL=1